MASDSEFVCFVCDQIDGAGEIRSRAMFGGHVVYCNDKVVGLITDNRFFVKITDAGSIKV